MVEKPWGEEDWHLLCILSGRYVVRGVMAAIAWTIGGQCDRWSIRVCAGMPPVNHTAGTSEAFNVVGVRADSSRHVMSVNLSLEDAIYLQAVLHRAAIFHEVVIEADDARPNRTTPEVVADHCGHDAG